MLNKVIEIVRSQRAYWPISDRTVHYELLNDPPMRCHRKDSRRYANDRDSYQDLTDVLTRARLFGDIPFDAIEDQTRTVRTWDTVKGVESFVGRELDEFLKNYWRDLQQSQPHHVEIVIEKLTVEGSVTNVAAGFCIPYTVGRGFCSLDPRYKMLQRFEKSGKDKLVVLIMSDFDPEGEEICMSFARSMRDDFGVTGILPKKVCLTHEQVLEKNLQNWVPAKKGNEKEKGSRKKKGSSNFDKFFAKTGNDHAFELEALPSAERSRLLREAILSVLDNDAYNAEVEAEAQDAAKLRGLRDAVGPLLMKALRGGEA